MQFISEGDTQITRTDAGQVLFETFDTVEGKGNKATTVTHHREILTDVLGPAVTFADDGVIGGVWCSGR